MHSYATYALFALQSGEGDGGIPLPTDPASIFVLALVVLVAGAVIWYGRPKGGNTDSE